MEVLASIGSTWSTVGRLPFLADTVTTVITSNSALRMLRIVVTAEAKHALAANRLLGPLFIHRSLQPLRWIEIELIANNLDLAHQLFDPVKGGTSVCWPFYDKVR